ncbi:MAG TPA: chromosomal replication initiator protein DnaA [Candidatus Magasanikbacteria bacterium]|nr:chromosomal replication initiator protein DnaA [Candidatus Magasanikbacteria bacterium]
MNNTEVWQAVLAELELSISKANFITWFKNTGIVTIIDGQVVVCVPNTFAKAWLEKKYHSMIIKSLERITERPIKRLEYKIENIKNVVEHEIDFNAPAKANLDHKPEISAVDFGNKKTSGGSSSFSLNPKYVFESYVVGKGSELAYAAAQAVVNKPGEAYNPLFIYGGVGLGKTHLLQAIGNSILKNNPQANIVYVSAEKFSNDFIQSVQEGKAKEFQNRYRNVDLLLIDDIQFIAGKDRTQESFFHTFNELHQQNKQVVLTSDRPPKAIPMLEDRLKSRFEWGMIADISSPDFETRAAILKKKCEEKNFELNEKSLFLIASTVQSNIRELEGALNKIIVFHQLKNISPTPESIKSILSSVEASQGQKMATPQQLTQLISDFYNVAVDDILGKSREKKLSFPRQIIMYMLREDLKMSYPSIGEELGGRDHTTAMHAHEKIKTEIEKDMKLRQEIELIKQKIYNS